jgi:hypothetical protein
VCGDGSAYASPTALNTVLQLYALRLRHVLYMSDGPESCRRLQRAVPSLACAWSSVLNTSKPTHDSVLVRKWWDMCAPRDPIGPMSLTAPPPSPSLSPSRAAASTLTRARALVAPLSLSRFGGRRPLIRISVSRRALAHLRHGDRRPRRRFYFYNVRKHVLSRLAGELGYNVLQTDTDVAWFANPFPALKAGTLGQHQLIIQPDLPLANAGVLYAQGIRPNDAAAWVLREMISRIRTLCARAPAERAEPVPETRPDEMGRVARAARVRGALRTRSLSLSVAHTPSLVPVSIRPREPQRT